MPEQWSKSIPGLARDTVGVIGEAIIKTELPRVKVVQATINASNLVPDEEQFVTWYQTSEMKKSTPGTFVLRVEKGGINSGALGDTEISVSYIAFQD